MEKEQINQLLDKQRQYFYSGATLDLDFRISALKRLRASIRKHEDQIHAALKKDLGKSNFESYMCETGLVLSEITHMLKNIRSYAKEQTVPTPLAQFHSHSFRKPSPYGVVLIMSPWNYPFLLTHDRSLHDRRADGADARVAGADEIFQYPALRRVQQQAPARRDVLQGIRAGLHHAREKALSEGHFRVPDALSSETVAGGAGGGPDLHGCPGRKLRGADVHFSLCN